MANGQIYITISDKRGEGGAGETPGVPSTRNSKAFDEPSNDFSAVGDYAKHQFFDMIKSNSQKVVNYSINNIGNFTGDYQQQRNASATLSLINAAKNIGMATIAGFKYGGGPYGAAVGAMVAVGGMMINYTMQENANQIAIKQQNRNIDILRDISGLNTLNDGSRGTEN